VSADREPLPPPIVVPGAPDAASDPLPSAPSAVSADDRTIDLRPPTVANDPHVPKADTDTVKEVTVCENDHSYKWSTDAQRLTVIAAIEKGLTPREASIEAGVSIRTTFRILSQAENTVEEMRAAFRKLLQAKALQRLADWELASEVGARKKGNHAPAKDWLLHAGVIDPLDSDTASVKVAIIIGTEEKPMRVPSPLAYTEE
jgi:hypothetical protein